MEFSIVADFGIIEEAYKRFYQLAACFISIEITVNYKFAIGFFKYLFKLSDNHPLLTVSDLTSFWWGRTCILYSLKFLRAKWE